MSHTINLKELERKAFRSTFQDGLWDMYLGFLLLTMGMGPVLPALNTSVMWTLVILLMLSVLAWLAFWAGKKFITTPRMGLVKFGPQRKAKLKKTRAVLFLSALLGVIMFVLRATWNIEWAAIPIPAYVWAVQAIVVFGLGAYFLDVSRFYAYGVLYAIPVPVGIVLLQNTGLPGFMFLPFGVSGVVMVLIGAVLFSRFLRDYPLLPEEA
ncbi:MAG: hypothetical protein OEW09_09420 [Anaerolineae bacterium]|nr:hypothetical protein [Anaerolineae bacterium]